MTTYLSSVTGRGGISARIVADSISSVSGDRLRTFEVEFPRFILPEVNTHRMLSKNTSSTRAIPVDRAIELVLDNPAAPIHWGENNPGMVSNRELDPTRKEAARGVWQAVINAVVAHVRVMSSKVGINGHKQWAGRWLETASFVKMVISGTELANWYYLRDHADAQPEIRELARVMLEAETLSTPTTLQPGEWHLPYVTVRDGRYFSGEDEIDLETAKQISASCCAQTSYRRNDDSVEKARKVFKMLNVGPVEERTGPPHSSPLEHQGTPIGELTEKTLDKLPEGVTHLTRDGAPWSGNFKGWVQHRQIVPNTAVW